MLKRVLIPLHLHESKEHLSEMAAFLKTLGTNEVVLLHVGADTRSAGEHHRRKLALAAEWVGELGFTVETALRPGSVQMEIVHTAEEREVHYISFAFRRKNWLKRAILGSTVKDVIRQADVPVFVYKQLSRKVKDDALYRVLYPTSLQWSNDIIIDYIRNKEFHPDQVIFLYVGRRAPDPVVEQQRRDAVSERLEETRRLSGLAEPESRQISVLGSPRRQIVKIARRLSADLVLLGKADSTSGMGPVLGSTAEEVSYNAPCSVLIIPRYSEVQENLEGRS
jgi:nucleotide-binding universal stress UspA family protein